MAEHPIHETVVLIHQGQRVRVQVEDSDGSIIVDYNSRGDCHLTVEADMPDTTDRVGIIYDEDFGGDRPTDHRVEVPPRSVCTLKTLIKQAISLKTGNKQFLLSLDIDPTCDQTDWRWCAEIGNLNPHVALAEIGGELSATGATQEEAVAALIELIQQAEIEKSIT